MWEWRPRRDAARRDPGEEEVEESGRCGSDGHGMRPKGGDVAPEEDDAWMRVPGGGGIGPTTVSAAGYGGRWRREWAVGGGEA